MVDTGLTALALGIGGTYALTQTDILGSGTDSEGGTSRRGGFSGIGRTNVPVGGGVPSIQRNVGNKKVNYAPESTNTTYNVNTQPRAGGGSKKENNSETSEGGSQGSESNTKKESSSSKDITRSPGGSGGESTDSTPTDPITGTETITKKAQQTPGVQADTPSGVTTELNRQQGFTRSQSSSEMSNKQLGINTGSKKESKTENHFGQGSITSGDFFKGSIF